MDQQRVRQNSFYCQKWTIFAFSLIRLFLCVILALMSNEIDDKDLELFGKKAQAIDKKVSHSI